MKKIDKDFKIAFNCLLCFMIIIMLWYIVKTSFTFDLYNGFAMWRYCKNSALANVFMMLAVVLVVLGCTGKFFRKINSGNFKYELIKGTPQKFFGENLKNIYLKNIMLLPVITTIPLIVGSIMYGNNIPSNPNGNPYVMFYENGVNNPILFVVLATTALLLASIFISNLALILNFKVKRVSLTVLAVFLVYNLLNFLTNFCFKFNMYYAFAPSDGSIFEPIIVFAILDIITFLVVYKLYLNKEKLVLNNG